MAWAIFDEMKGLSGFRCFLWFSVTSPVRNREVNSLEKLIEIEPLLTNNQKTWSNMRVQEVDLRGPK